ncbi:MAG: hypothetical protein JEY97_09845 [Bacteroidales bacterium]|nr:hypothetical protein [Bacteroidales bacterium]
MKNHILSIIIVSVFIFYGLNKHAISQTKPHSEEITIIAPYQPSISDAIKIHLKPKIEADEHKLPSLNYLIVPVKLSPNFQLSPIEPIEIEEEAFKDLYKNFVRLGLGNYATPYFEFFANKLQSKKQSFGIHLKHISSTGSMKDYAFPGYSKNHIDVFAKKFTGSQTLSANAFYNRDVFHYYGFKPDDYPDTSISKNDNKQIFSTIGFTGRIQSNNIRKGNLNHNLGLKYYYFFDNYKSQEHNVFFDAKFDKNLKMFDFTDNQTLGFITEVDFYSNNDPLKTTTNAILRLKPFLETRFEQYNFYVGVDMSLMLDTVTKFHFFPNLKAEVNVVPDVLSAYAGLRGEFYKNSFKSLCENNPFIVPIFPLDYSTQKIEFYGGLTISPAKGFDVNISAGASSNDNMPFFVSDSNSIIQNKFTLDFDDVKKIWFNAEFAYQSNENLKLMLNGKYRQYTMENELKPWYTPEFKLSFAANYIYKERFIFKSEIFANSEMYAKIFEKNKMIAKKIDGMLDINLGLEYRHTKSLSGFINLNNIANSKYEKWYNYPVQGFNVLLGITYSF